MQITTCEGQKQILSWFPTVTEEEILAVYEAAVPTNTKKTSKLALTKLIYKYGLLFLDVRLSVKTDTKLFVYNCSLQQLRQSNSSVIV